MARILGIDYGKVRTGLATTDPKQIIVTALDTTKTDLLEMFLINYCKKESVEKIVFGYPRHTDGEDTYLVEEIKQLINRLKTEIVQVEFDFQDERNTSVLAKNIIFNSGIKKSKRRDKSLVDQVSAVVILQRYLGHF
ncbi:MAG: Holliday junction resolvase RuvX [Saprospiraceae bacterium]